MAYKDKDKQRKAVKEAVRRHRQGITQIKPETKDVIPNVIPEQGSTSLRDDIEEMKASMTSAELYKAQYETELLPQAPVIPTKSLPACVPKILHARYYREPEYAKVIDRLLTHTIEELKMAGIWIPVWRYSAGEESIL